MLKYTAYGGRKQKKQQKKKPNALLKNLNSVLNTCNMKHKFQ